VNGMSEVIYFESSILYDVNSLSQFDRLIQAILPQKHLLTTESEGFLLHSRVSMLLSGLKIPQNCAFLCWDLDPI